MIDTRAVALQGVGYGAGATATMGFFFVGVIVTPTSPFVAVGGAGGGGIGPFVRQRRARRGEAFDPRSEVALAYQIAEEDEIVVAVVMAAVPLMGS